MILIENPWLTKLTEKMDLTKSQFDKLLYYQIIFLVQSSNEMAIEFP